MLLARPVLPRPPPWSLPPPILLPQHVSVCSWVSLPLLCCGFGVGLRAATDIVRLVVGLAAAASSVDAVTARGAAAAARRQGGPEQLPESLCPAAVHTVAHAVSSVMAAVPSIPTTAAVRQSEQWHRHPPALTQVHAEQVCGCQVCGRSCSFVDTYMHAWLPASLSPRVWIENSR